MASIHGDSARVAVVPSFWCFSAALRTQSEQFSQGVRFILSWHFGAGFIDDLFGSVPALECPPNPNDLVL
jgi:hypothetical protein